MKKKEPFIPYSREEIIQFCLQEGSLTTSQGQKFRDFCTILAAYYHFQFHDNLESLKSNYAPFDPDGNITIKPPLRELLPMKVKLVAAFEELLARANYFPISKASLQRALQEKSLLELETRVDLNDLDQIVCYCRGEMDQVITRKKWFFWKEQQTVQFFERVALLIKFKKAAALTAKKIKQMEKFTSSHIYLYLYKDIPKFDLEFLFPNIKISMTKKDRLIFGIPALGAAFSIVFKVLPKLLLVISILFYVMGWNFNIEALQQVGEEDVENVTALLVALLSLILTLGGFAFQQYSKYQSKQIKFQKDVTDNLFYRLLATNAGVFKSLIDGAEEEECKEIILVYYHLLTKDVPFTPAELDKRIEKWMEDKFGTSIDFDVHGTLNSLEKIRGKVREQELSLLSYDNEGHCQVLSLDEAKTVIDYVWDNVFLYSG